MFDNLINLYKSQGNLSRKWLLLLIFLFPIAGPVIRHWSTAIFPLIMLTAIYSFFAKKDRKPLYKEEKIYLWAFFLFFCIFIVSTVTNGYSWEMIQKEGLGTEINYLLFIPLYLLIRENNSSKDALYEGILFSIPVIFAFSLYEYFYLLPSPKDTALQGAYSQLFIGPITALMLIFSIIIFKEKAKNKLNYFWLFFIISTALLVIIYSQARTAYLTIAGTSIVLLFLTAKNVTRIIASLIVLMIFLLFSFQIDAFKNRISAAADNISHYFQKSNDVNSGTTTSLGLRLEVWRSAKYIVNERPLIGIGNGNYPAVIKKYIERDLVGESVIEMGHAHNTFVEALITKGIIGLSILLLLFYYPIYLIWKNRKKDNTTYTPAIIFITAISLMSLGESMLINKNNGVAYLLMFLAILFSSLIQDIKKHNNPNSSNKL